MILEQVQNLFPVERWRHYPVVIAVSGGADSVALTRALNEIAIQNSVDRSQLIIAHIDHRLRGVESDEDVTFVRNLALDWNLKFNLIRLNPDDGPHSEESLRKLRYENLISIATEVGARYVVFGHTMDDQVETILFRIFRGTGVDGLQGIPVIRPLEHSISAIRPLIQTSREVIEQWLTEIGQDFRVDSTNQRIQFTRNFIRNELLPMIRQRFGEDAGRAVLRLSQQAQEIQSFITEQLQPLWSAVELDDPVTIDCEVIGHQHEVLLRKLLVEIWIRKKWPRQDMSFHWWKTMANSLRTESSDVILNLPNSIRFERKEKTVTLTQPGRG